MPPPLLWILLAAAVAAGLVVGVLMWRRRQAPGPLPVEWSLTPRPVFNHDERRLYRLLREALPHHVVLAKLPLVRFCQPNEPKDVRYWYELLGPLHVGFAICSPNGRVLAAIDLDNGRATSQRGLKIKQSVLGACRVRYLRCPGEQLPSIPELQLLVPAGTTPSRSPTGGVSSAGRSRPTAAPHRRDRDALWRDSSFFHDSFFGPDSRWDSGMPSEIPGMSTPSAGPPSRSGGHSWVDGTDERPATVVDPPSPRYGSAPRG